MFPIRAVVDDHVDRPGVEVRQRMKLTGTNSSIGLIVLIASVHRKMNNQRRVQIDKRDLCDKPQSGLSRSHQLLNQSCALPTWWLWRGGRTRSLSEHGRETPLRPWYFVLRRGRVGRCQVCKTQLYAKLLKAVYAPQIFSDQNGSSRVTIGR